MKNENQFNLFESVACLNVIIFFACVGGAIGFAAVYFLLGVCSILPIVIGASASLILLNEGTKPNGILVR